MAKRNTGLGKKRMKKKPHKTKKRLEAKRAMLAAKHAKGKGRRKK